MKKILTASWACILTVIIACFAQAESVIPPGSFIKTEVQSVDQLIMQVQKDPVVKKRYASHFGVSPDYLVDYLKSEMELVTLREPLRTRVWYVGKDSKIFSKTKLLPRGSQVFSDKSGKPLILWRCGNPLLSALPAKAPVPPVPVVEVKPAEPEVVSAPPALTSPPPVLTPLAGSLESAPAGFATGPMAAVPSIVTAGGGGLSLLPLVAGGGGVLFLFDGGDGGDGGSPPVLAPPVIPEFTTAALALIGLLPAAFLAQRGRQRV